jgi:hypothetical protein
MIFLYLLHYLTKFEIYETALRSSLFALRSSLFALRSSLIMFFLMFENCLLSQPGIPLHTCSEHLNTATPNTLGNNLLPCNNNLSQFFQLHSSLVPDNNVGTIKINVNFIFVQNHDGIGNFQTSDAQHMILFDAIVNVANNKLNNLIEFACSNCATPLYYDKSHIEIIPHFIEVQSDLLFDHMNDPVLIPGNGSIFVPTRPFLLNIVDIAKIQSGYINGGINWIITNHGKATLDLLNSTVGTAHWQIQGYTEPFNGYVIAESPSIDLSKEMILHHPDGFIKYFGFMNFYAPNNQWWANLDWIPNNGQLLAHEVLHYLGLPDILGGDCVENIMNNNSSNGANSKVALTSCQLTTIFQSLVTLSSRNAIVCENAIQHSISVTVNETWKNNLRILGDVVVKNGATLTITCEVHMSPNGKFVVERGGILVVDGGLLTGYCNDNWRGIVVEGDVPGEQAMSGKVILKNAAIIENAKTAVSMYPYYMPWDNGGLLNYFGGIVQAEQCTIRLCNRAVEFMKYGQGGLKDESTFKNVLFEDLQEGITEWADDGVTFEKCTFRKIAKRGIHPYDSEVIVNEGCTFAEQPYGVDAISTYPVPLSPKIGKKGTIPNQFNCLKAGVNIQSGSNIEPFRIAHNVFTKGSYGVRQNGNGLIDINHNEFNQHLYSSIEFFDGGTQSNFINENDFIDSYNGTHAIKQNTGLLILDNCFSSNSIVDIFVSIGSISPEQGNSNVAAGNCFTKNNIPELDNDAGNGGVNYYVKAGTPITSCKRPVKSPSIMLLNADTNNGVAECGPQFFGGSGGEKFCGASDYMSISDLKILHGTILQAIADLSSTSSPSNQSFLTNYKVCLERLENLIGQKMLDPSSSDPNSGRENAITFFSAPEMDFMGKITAYGIIVHNGQITRAKTYLNTLLLQNQEQIDFVAVQNINLDYLEEPFAYELQQADKNYLFSVGTSDGTLNGYARSIYEVLTGERIEVQVPEIIIERSDSFNNSQEKIQEIRFSPNPVLNGVISIRGTNLISNEMCKISLMDLSGVNKHFWEFAASEKLDLNLIDVTTGIYFLKVVDSKGKILLQTKLVVFN